jgi:hypothetical protein
LWLIQLFVLAAQIPSGEDGESAFITLPSDAAVSMELEPLHSGGFVAPFESMSLPQVLCFADFPELSVAIGALTQCTYVLLGDLGHAVSPERA